MTIFTKIINGEIPSYKVAENEYCYAFLDINPLVKGHTLVIPKLPEPEADYIFDLDDDTYQQLTLFAQKVGMEVNHVHIHLVPMNSEKDMLFTNPKLQLPADEMAQIANSIAQAIDPV